MEKMSLLNDTEIKQIELGETLEKDYFYIPIIYYSETNPDYEEHYYSLRFNDQDPPASLLAYASKVPVKKTLWQAVRYDLENDFHYPHEKSFMIEQIALHDTARTQNGNELTRILVWVSVYEKFALPKIRQINASPFWFYEGEYLPI